MAKVSLGQQIMDLETKEFEFSAIRMERTSKGERVAVLTLVDPLKEVVGTQRYPFGGKLHNYRARNITEVRIHEREYKGTDDLQWDNDQEIGTYKGTELFFDVAKSTNDVWLVKEGFNVVGNKMRSNNINSGVDELIAKQQGITLEEAQADRQKTAERVPAGQGAGLQPVDARG